QTRSIGQPRRIAHAMRRAPATKNGWTAPSLCAKAEPCQSDKQADRRTPCAAWRGSRMKLGLPDDSSQIQEMFERFFAGEATSERVRAAEPVGFDPALWRDLVGLEAPFLRLSADAGGGGMSLFDACLMMEQAGRRL